MLGLTVAPALVLGADGALLPARYQMALSLGWHIILACFGMALPAMIFVFHRKGLAGDVDALELAKRWSKVAGVLFAIGAVSGTVLSFEMGLLWPGLMERYGDVIGLAFALEGIAFFTEAIFLGIYIYGWGRLPPRLHSWMLAPVVAAGFFGSFFVVSVNGWMNDPGGFTVVDGVVTDVDPVGAMFSEATLYEFPHMFVAAYMVTGFGAAAVYALARLRGRDDRHHRLGMMVPLTFAVIAAPLQPLIGHFAGQRIADHQPAKLAAIEGLADTEESVNVVLGGVYVDGEIKGGITVPVDGLGSLLAQNSRDAEIVGLNDIPPDERPPVNVVRIAFQVMVAIGTALVGLAAWTALRWRRHRGALGDSRAFLAAIVAAGPAAVVAMEAGWITTEVGRQPWIVHGLMRTADAVTDSPYVWATLSGLVVTYAAMTVAAVVVLRSMARRWAAGERDLASPYGPAPAQPADATDRAHVAVGSAGDDHR